MRRGTLATAGLALIIALIAKDLAVPLAGIAAFGLLDRLLSSSPKDIWRQPEKDPARL
jgi:hypothetical protein